MAGEYRAPVWYWVTLYAALGVLLVLFIVFLILFIRARAKARKGGPGGRGGSVMEGVADLITEDYKFRRTLTSSVNALDARERARYDAAFSSHRESVDGVSERLGLDVVTYDGLTYDEKWPVDPLNADEFTPGEALVVMQTVEPTIIDKQNGRILKYGTVTLGRKAQR